MGLSDAIARRAGGQAHALVVEVPGLWRVRAAAERAVLARGWHLALSPADADVLVVCGEPGPRLAAAIEAVWQQMPGPRVRIHVREYDDVAARLDEAYTGLLDTAGHRHDAHHRPTVSDLPADRAEDTGRDREAHDGAGDDGAGHGGHGDMEMLPGGIPLAGGAEDRDGLEMDVLDLRLGPVLPHWPAGLVLRCSLHGDVITEAEAELVDGSRPPDPRPASLALRIDHIASLLALAGWDGAAAEARRVRDATLGYHRVRAAAVSLDRLRRKVRGSRLLRRSLRGVGPLSEEYVHRHGLPAVATGDTYDRLIGMLDRTADPPGAHPAGCAADRGTDHQARLAPNYSTGHVATLVTGLDLATARLVVASLDIHQLRAGPPQLEVPHG